MAKQGLVLCLMAAVASSAFAGAEIDLRPTPPVPPGGYLPDTLVNIDVFFVDTGNPQGDISFRGIQLDFTDTTGTLTYPGEDGIPGNDDDDKFTWWRGKYDVGAIFPDLPTPAWLFPATHGVPEFQITMPDDGEVWIGEINVNVGADGGILDVMNGDEPDVNLGAWARFGWGFEDDPVVTWRAYTGELTGGQLHLPTIPEPGTMILLGVGGMAFLRRRTR